MFDCYLHYHSYWTWLIMLSDRIHKSCLYLNFRYQSYITDRKSHIYISCVVMYNSKWMKKMLINFSNQNICEISCRLLLKYVSIIYFPMISTQKEILRPKNYMTAIFQQQQKFVLQSWYTCIWSMEYFFRPEPYLCMASSIWLNISPRI